MTQEFMDQAVVATVGIVGLVIVAKSVVRHNLKTCPRCKGTRKNRSSMFSGRYQVCTRCQGAGEVRAWFGSK